MDSSRPQQPSREKKGSARLGLAGSATATRSVRDAMTTVGGGFASQFALLISGILAARLLGVEDRGQLALFGVIAVAASFIAATGLPAAITYWVARDRPGSRALARLMVRVGFMQAVVGVAIQVAVLALAVRGEDDSVQLAALVSVPVVPAMIAVMDGMAFLQGYEKFKPWTAVRLLPAVLYTLTVGVLAATGTASLLTLTASFAGSYVIAGVVAVWRAAKELPSEEIPAPKPPFWPLQKFGAKAFLGNAQPTDALQLDQVLVGLVLSPSALGLYVVGLAFTNLPRIIAQSIGFVVYPHVARRPNRREARRSMWLATALTALVVGAIVGILEATVGWLLPLFFGDEFSGAVELSRVLLVAAALVSVRRVLADGARGAGYPGLGTVAEVAAAVVLIPAVAVLAGPAGATGVALALVIAGAVGLAVLLIGLTMGASRFTSDKVEMALGPEPTAWIGDAPR